MISTSLATPTESVVIYLEIIEFVYHLHQLIPYLGKSAALLELAAPEAEIYPGYAKKA